MGLPASSEASDDNEVDEAEGLGESIGEAKADVSLSTVVVVTVRRMAGLWRAAPLVVAEAMFMVFSRSLFHSHSHSLLLVLLWL